MLFVPNVSYTFRCALYLELLRIPFFFFNDTATTEIYTLSLHDALPISFDRRPPRGGAAVRRAARAGGDPGGFRGDRKSTRLNSSHSQISYAVFCLKKKTRHEVLLPLHSEDVYQSRDADTIDSYACSVRV